MSDSTVVCPTDTSNCTYATCPLDCAYILYRPSVAGNATYLAIFAVILAAQCGLGIWYRTWSFLIGMFGGLVLEVLGYVGRLMLHHQPYNFSAFLLYLIPLTIGPAFLTASIYMCLSHIIIANGEAISRFSPRTVAITFVCFDIISLILQAAGGAISASSDSGSSDSNTGRWIMVGGLAWQVASLVIFMLVWGNYILRLRRASEDQKSEQFRNLRNNYKPFKWFTFALWLATILIVIRSIYRVVELEGGFTGTVASNEAALMVLEGPMIIVATLALSVLHPGYCFGGSWSITTWSARKRQKSQPMSEAEGVVPANY